jgi:hypothetical protein
LGDSIFAWPRPNGNVFTARTAIWAWVMQERVLSPRILFFTNYGIFWAYRQGDANERVEEGMGFRDDDDAFRSTNAYFGSSVKEPKLVTTISKLP